MVYRCKVLGWKQEGGAVKVHFFLILLGGFHFVLSTVTHKCDTRALAFVMNGPVVHL